MMKRSLHRARSRRRPAQVFYRFRGGWDVGMSKPNVEPVPHRRHDDDGCRRKESNLLTPFSPTMFTPPGQVPFVATPGNAARAASLTGKWAAEVETLWSYPTRPGDALDRAADRECTPPVWRGRY